MKTSVYYECKPHTNPKQYRKMPFYNVYIKVLNDTINHLYRHKLKTETLIFTYLHPFPCMASVVGVSESVKHCLMCFF